jgi:hypothetical protein
MSPQVPRAPRSAAPGISVELSERDTWLGPEAEARLDHFESGHGLVPCHAVPGDLLEPRARSTSLGNHVDHPLVRITLRSLTNEELRLPAIHPRGALVAVDRFTAPGGGILPKGPVNVEVPVGWAQARWAGRGGSVRNLMRSRGITPEAADVNPAEGIAKRVAIRRIRDGLPVRRRRGADRKRRGGWARRRRSANGRAAAGKQNRKQGQGSRLDTSQPAFGVRCDGRGHPSREALWLRFD